MSVNNGTYTRNNLGVDGNIHPRFFIDSIQDQAASEIAGRPIFKDEERVEIIMPGNPWTRPVCRVTDEHRQRWPKEYEAFKGGQEMSVEGTPLEEWAILKRSQVMELKALGFKTVEHVRDMNDGSMQRIGMGGRKLREAAMAFLDDAERVAQNTRLQAEAERNASQIAALTRQVEELGAMLKNNFAELQTMKDTPNPLMTHIPGMSDPVELAKTNHVQEIAPSSLDNIGSRRGRKPMPRDAEGNIIREKVA